MNAMPRESYRTESALVLPPFVTVTPWPAQAFRGDGSHRRGDARIVMIRAKSAPTTTTGKLIYIAHEKNRRSAKFLRFGLPTERGSRPSLDRYIIDPAIPGRS